jgi:hypothetical protein
MSVTDLGVLILARCRFLWQEAGAAMPPSLSARRLFSKVSGLMELCEN